MSGVASPIGPDVTVVIPTCGRWHFLAQTLQSALGQEAVALEVVVVDDASADETPDRLADLEDPRVRLVRHETRQGVARVRNDGIEAARGEWVAFLDDDDLWSPQKLRRQLDAAVGGGASFAYGGAVLVEEDGRVLRAIRAPDPETVAHELLRGYPIPAGSSNVIARTALLRDLGGFDERLHQLADWDMWLRLALNGSAAACHEPLVAYRLHPENMLLESARGIRREFEHLVAKHRDAGASFDAADFYRWVAGGHRRAGRRLAASRAYVAASREGRGLEDAVRAIGVLLGERVMELGRRSRSQQVEKEPEWLTAWNTGSSKDRGGFERAWRFASPLEGWLSEAQARKLFEAARSVPDQSWIVEIGSHHGKSTVVLARAKPGGVQLLAVDPFEDPRWGGGSEALEVFKANLERAGVSHEVELFRGTSEAASASWSGAGVGLLFVDGAHDRRSVLADIDAWERFVPKAGLVYFHDAFSSVGVTLALLQRHLFNRSFVYLDSIGTLCGFRSQELSWPRACWSSLRLLARLPYFARNVIVKVGLRRGWPRLVRTLGHQGREDPF
jgi:glycosyltransferase involved in cell wall biosynthesis/predicted O-methyltransferase YrrM